MTAEELNKLPKAERDAFFACLTPLEAQQLQYEWRFWARPKQIEMWDATDWRTFLLMWGRGTGKTRTAAEWIRHRVETDNFKHRIALINDTAADVREVMVEGNSGLIAISPPWNRPKYEPSKRRLTWPNGAIATCYAAEAPDLLRGPEHSIYWADEPAKWRNLRRMDAEGNTAWDNLQMGLRIGPSPRGLCTTTPRNIKWLKDLLQSPSTRHSRASSWENRANLSPEWFEDVIAPYVGTRKGRQEIDAELLEDNPNALWSRDNIERNRISPNKCPDLARIVVAVDPMGADPSVLKRNDKRPETGIIVAGIDFQSPPHGYILADYSICATPKGWGNAVRKAYEQWNADRVVAEKNFGGKMVEFTIMTIALEAGVQISYKDVQASRGKVIRAEPVVAQYEQNRWHHVGCFPQLEDELCDWSQGQPSPNRLDACVWSAVELMGKPKKVGKGAWAM